ncbi:DnaD domain protein [Aerococcus viridans]|uniref:DnaD domain protein n=1 Tax=Aerococcus viridans TaxID=1377 RepID=UPI000311B0AB|nr:DnaD domain protein [Aerococcus viridans]
MPVTYPWQNLDPKGLVQITQPHWISDIDQQVLLHLYQPIIGGTAYAFYQTLYANIQLSDFASIPLRHFDLMEQMVAGKEQYVKARRQLEAIGLLQVFEKSSHQNQDDVATIYQLQAPLDSKHIFSDPIMSSLLMGRLGQDRYQLMLDKFSIKMPVDLKSGDWTEVTATFQDVYRLPSQYYPISDEIEDKLVAKNSQTKATTITSSTLDMNALKELLQSSFISEKAITAEVNEMFVSLHQLYGFDEVDLKELALSATDLRTNTIDVRKLQRLALDKSSSQTGISNVQPAKASTQGTSSGLTDRITVSEARGRQQADQADQHWLGKGLSKEELSFSKLARSYPPIAFAKSIKEQKGGYLTKSEGNAITELIQLEVIQPATLNVMVQFCLIELEQNRLTRSYLESVADDWRQNKVVEPEEAMLYLKQRKQKSAENYEKRQKNRMAKGRYQTQKQSVKPKWLDPDSRQDKYQKPVVAPKTADQEGPKQDTAVKQENKASLSAQEAEIQQLLHSLNQKEGE